ncbi:tRNA pseudouridine(38-40) synthase TruA [Lujinxingia litoralis]|uniref:tRNA pseudouridine synthase A n=1 Tax=Lujinxingia litoralis TaxID=2211119 RepID=A0A328CAH3_9DELT|nr:tRNA pseudouridine(38-40) synthase TruA [Lujinxingia litoralis]RAL22247.1 tRNA pseudouridine(38-40) synthase TruA [Lujinxingia litoralis]
MVRVRLHIVYRGSAYHGWQIQPRDRTVEGELTRAVQTVLGLEAPVKVQGASRTDSGVHALGQVAHFDHESPRKLWDFVRALNALTDDDICVTRAEEAAEGFHARHSARGKIYRYRIWNHRFNHPFLGDRVWQMGSQLDLERMRQAAAKLVGTHDFEGFRTTGCDSPTTVRKMRRVEVHTRGPSMIEVEVEGTAFLKHMVRIMVGTLVDIGAGRMELSRIDEVFESGERRRAGQTAPACGLTLERVFYPDFPWAEPAPELGGAYLPVGLEA